MAWYKYWQQHGEDYWHLALEEAIPSILEDKKPAFTTVLSLDTQLEGEDIPFETFNKVKFKGDFYVDFDGEDIEEVISQVHKFMRSLGAKGVRLDEIEYGLTGGRGFHILIPPHIFIQNPSSSGYQYLPLFYKSMAYDMYVDCLDMRVYSTKRGRMWRTYNVERNNGKYKVQATHTEMLEMTAEKYEELTSQPRSNFSLPRPTFAPDFALLFAKAKDETEKKLKGRRKNTRDKKLIEQYNGEVPPTIEMLMAGEIAESDKGYHAIAMQIAIATNALGMTEEEVLTKSEGVFNLAHESDGNRYNTPEKRRRELRRLFHYMGDNPCYEFSVGGVISVVKESHNAEDLDLSDVPRPDEGDLEGEEAVDPLFMGLLVRRQGVWRESFDKEVGEVVQRKVSNVGISEVHELLDHETEESTGFEVTIHVSDSKPLRKKVNNNDFDSKISLRRALGAQNFINLPDSQIGALQEVFRAMATKSGNKVRTLPLEGINVMTRNEPIAGTHFRVRWADAHRVWGFEYEGEESLNFRLEGPFSQDGELQTDLVNAPHLQDTEETRDYFDKVFGFFPAETTARVLGWYMSNFVTQHIRAYIRQYPLLQVYGEAGSGKTSFTQLCANLHYYKRAPKIISAGGVTAFAMEAPLASSGTIPVIFDEFKPREMQLQRLNAMLMLMRNNFNGTSGSKGKVSKDSGHSQLGVANTANTAPMTTISEAKITQEAIVHRSVMAAFPDKHTGSQASMDFQMVKNRAWRMGELGRVMLDLALKTPVETIGEEIERIQNEIVASNPPMADRIVFSYAVVVLGLQLGQSALRQVFGDRYDDTLQKLMDSVITKTAEEEQKSMSEVNRVINDLSYLSHRGPEEQVRLIMDDDYSIISFQGEECIDLNLRNCWDKYTRFIRNQGGELLFDREMSFVDSALRHAGRIQTNFSDNPNFTKGRSTSRMVRLRMKHLYETIGVDEFNS